MAQMGIPELKARLSQHVRRAEAGISVTITDRGRPIAVLGPIATGANVAWAHTMLANGRATWSGGKPSGLTKRIPNRGRLASKEIIEDRR
jgi:prevent-host-death family protein